MRPQNLPTAASPAGQSPSHLTDVRDDRIVTCLSDTACSLEAGQAAACQLMVTNAGPLSASFVVSVTGLDRQWVTLSPAALSLKPGARGQVIVTVGPLAAAADRAGTYPLTIAVTSPQYPGRLSQHGLTLAVRPHHAFIIGELFPRQQSVPRFKHSGQVVIPLANEGNAEATIRLSGVDFAGSCHFEFQVPGASGSLAGQAELRLLPGEHACVPVRITPPPRRLFGLVKETYPFTITATMRAKSPATRTTLGVLSVTPAIGPWLVSSIVGCLVLLGALVMPIGQPPVPPEARMARAGQTGQAVPANGPAAIAVQPEQPAALPNLEAANLPQTYEAMFRTAAAQFGLDWRLLAELAYQESRMNPQAIGRSLDQGLMQIIPATWNKWAPQVGASNPFDPYSSVQVAAAYLAHIRDISQALGHPEPYWMLIGYNWGPDNLRRLFENNGGWGQVPEKQRRYALDILQAVAGAQDRWQEPLSAGTANTF